MGSMTVVGDLPAALTSEQKQLLKDTFCKGATDEEFKLAVQVCNRLRLDPFAKQIHFLKRSVKDGNSWKEVMTHQISIDGFRAVAHRTGEYRGQTQPEWCGADGVWRDCWLDDGPPKAARCGVHRAGFNEPVYAVAKYDSYVAIGKSGPMPMWRKMPEVMLHKCAESLALRKAFPNELSGAYTSDEMQQSDNPEQHGPIARPAPTLVRARETNAKDPVDPEVYEATRARLKERVKVAVTESITAISDADPVQQMPDWDQPPCDPETGEVLSGKPMGLQEQFATAMASAKDEAGLKYTQRTFAAQIKDAAEETKEECRRLYRERRDILREALK